MTSTGWTLLVYANTPAQGKKMTQKEVKSIKVGDKINYQVDLGKRSLIVYKYEVYDIYTSSRTGRRTFNLQGRRVGKIEHFDMRGPDEKELQENEWVLVTT